MDDENVEKKTMEFKKYQKWGEFIRQAYSNDTPSNEGINGNNKKYKVYLNENMNLKFFLTEDGEVLIQFYNNDLSFSLKEAGVLISSNKVIVMSKDITEENGKPKKAIIMISKEKPSICSLPRSVLNPHDETIYSNVNIDDMIDDIIGFLELVRDESRKYTHGEEDSQMTELLYNEMINLYSRIEDFEITKEIEELLYERVNLMDDGKVQNH